MEWTTSALIVAATLNLVIGVLVLARNSQRRLNRYFVGLTFAITGWTVTNALFAITSGGTQYAIALLSYGFGGFAGVFFGLFCIEYLFSETGKMYINKPLLKFAVLSASAINILSMLPGVVGKEVTQEGGIITNLPMLILYGLALITFVILGLRALRIARKQAGKESRQRTNAILFGLAIAAAVGIFFNLILPIQGIYSFVTLGPLGSIAIVAGCAYAIARHRLFDIRLVVARAMGYLLAVVFVGVAYGLIAFTITGNLILHDGYLTSQQRLVFTLSAVVIAFSWSYIKKFFDQLTNFLFYRDAYDPQVFIDEFNRVLVSYTDLRSLLNQSVNLIRDTFKAEYCVFWVPDPSDRQKFILFGSDDAKTSSLELPVPDKNLWGKVSTHVLVVDGLDPKDEKIKAALVSQNIAILAEIAPDASPNDKLGYIFVGDKKSGNAYNRQDVKMFEIITNSLVIALQNAYRFEEIKTFNTTLQSKVDDATRELRRKNERLRLLDQTKDDFISMASHQLRTPLTSVKGYVSMVLDGDAGPINATQRKLLTQAFLSAQRMVYLISDLLNVSRLKTGKFIIEPVESRLDKVVEEELEQLTETVKSRGLTLTYHKPEHFPTLMIDETKIRQVIMNFVDNAIYYTPSGGTIDVYLEDKGASIEFRVVDTGIGVPKHEQHHLFTKFYRASNAKNARPDGTGLGIFMAKKVVIAQGGAVIFKSAEGKGSTFGFTFPKAKLLPKLSPKAEQSAAA